MKANLSRLLSLVTIAGAMVTTGCASQPSANTQKSADPSPNLYATGSRLAVKNTTELIGLKTIDQTNIRDSKMFTNIVVDGK